MEPLGGPVTVQAYVYANHSGKFSNRRSHSGILICVNNALLKFYSQIQNTVELSSFGSEFVELRIVTDMVEALRYKLRKFGLNL